MAYNPENAIVIPALNEEKTIAKVVDAVRNFGQVIVVDDGSKDRTAKVAEEAGAVVVKHSANRGYDGALQSGFEKANQLNCKFVVTIDADGQHRGELVEKYFELLRAGNEFVLGIRSKKARVSEQIYSLVTKALYGVDDPLCGMKGYNMDWYRRLGHFDSVGSTGTELAIYGIRNKAKFVQLPIPVFERVGASRFGNVLKGNYRIFRSMLLTFASTSRK